MSSLLLVTLAVPRLLEGAGQLSFKHCIPDIVSNCEEGLEADRVF